MNELQLFESSEFGKLEVLEIEGKPFFPATACAKILGYVDPYDAIKRHTKGSVKHRVPTMGGNQDIKIIPEGDLYRLIVHSNLPASERFERWVFDTVLPELRSKGQYGNLYKLEDVIQKTAAAVVTEVIRQLVPVLTQSVLCTPDDDEADRPIEVFTAHNLDDRDRINSRAREILIRERKNLHLTQAQMARVLEINRSVYANIENGIKFPGKRTALKVAGILEFDWKLFYPERA